MRDPAPSEATEPALEVAAPEGSRERGYIVIGAGPAPVSPEGGVAVPLRVPIGREGEVTIPAPVPPELSDMLRSLGIPLLPVDGKPEVLFGMPIPTPAVAVLVGVSDATGTIAAAADASVLPATGLCIDELGDENCEAVLYPGEASDIAFEVPLMDGAVK